MHRDTYTNELFSGNFFRIPTQTDNEIVWKGTFLCPSNALTYFIKHTKNDMCKPILLDIFYNSLVCKLNPKIVKGYEIKPSLLRAYLKEYGGYMDISEYNLKNKSEEQRDFVSQKIENFICTEDSKMSEEALDIVTFTQEDVEKNDEAPTKTCTEKPKKPPMLWYMTEFDSNGRKKKKNQIVYDVPRNLKNWAEFVQKHKVSTIYPVNPKTFVLNLPGEAENKQVMRLLRKRNRSQELTGTVCGKALVFEKKHLEAEQKKRPKKQKVSNEP